MREIIVKNILGENLQVEDAIILKDELNIHLEDKVILNFEGVKTIGTGFFAALLTELMCRKGREYLIEHLEVTNLCDKKYVECFKTVVLGTACCNCPQ